MRHIFVALAAVAAAAGAHDAPRLAGSHLTAKARISTSKAAKPAATKTTKPAPKAANPAPKAAKAAPKAAKPAAKTAKRGDQNRKARRPKPRRRRPKPRRLATKTAKPATKTAKPPTTQVAAAASNTTPVVTGSKPVSAMNGWSLDALSTSQLNTSLATLQADGITAIRNDATWNTIEPSQGSWSWSYYDNLVTAYAQHHLTWLPILDYSALWAASTPGDEFSLPASDSAYATYAAAVASRYGPGGSFWAANPTLPYEPVSMFEVWNEENAGYFAGPSNPSAYAQLYAAARTAIHQVDPTATVTVGGLVYWGSDDPGGIDAVPYMQDMLNDDPGLVVDAWGLHPYDANGLDVADDVAGFRGYLDEEGETSVPIAVTEFGWAYTQQSEATRASWFATVSSELGDSNCGVSVLAPYDWQDPATDDYGIAGRASATSWLNGLATAPLSGLCT